MKAPVTAMGVVAGSSAGALTGYGTAVKRKKTNERLRKMDDPFGIEKSLRPPKPTDKVRQGVHGAKQAFKNRGQERVIPGERENSFIGGKFGGKADPSKREKQIKRVSLPLTAGVGGIYGGSIVGSHHKKDERLANTKQIDANRKEIKNLKAVSKRSKAETVYRITDKGTRAAKQGFHGDSPPQRPKRRAYPSKGTVASGVLGGAIGYDAGRANARSALRQQQGTLRRQDKQIANLKKNLEQDMSISAFGVDHGDFSKADDKYGRHGAPSAGRRASAFVFGPAHSAVAGKKGKKLKATGTTLGYGVGGSVAGATAGAVTRKPALAGLGSNVGQITGTQMAVNRNQRKGRYKKES